MIKDVSVLSKEQNIDIYFRDGHAEAEIKSISKDHS